MSFDIYRIEPFSEGHWSLEKIQPLPLAGVNGLFARHLLSLAGENLEWNVDPATLLQWAGMAETASLGIFFDLTPGSPSQINLLKLEGARGRTASLLTDIVFHFKIACASRNAAQFTRDEKRRVLPDWSANPDRFEYLRLAGGTKGGSWAWSEPPQAATATIV